MDRYDGGTVSYLELRTTHITNGAYRLHPTEWAAGKAAGKALAWALEHGVDPGAMVRDAAQMEGLQAGLARARTFGVLV